MIVTYFLRAAPKKISLTFLDGRGRAIRSFTQRPPDADHPYGHRKYETMASLAILVFMIIVLIQIFETAMGRLRTASMPTEAAMSQRRDGAGWAMEDSPQRHGEHGDGVVYRTDHSFVPSGPFPLPCRFLSVLSVPPW